MQCEDAIREMSNYLDNEVTAELRQRLDDHLRECESCALLLEEMLGTLSVLGDDELLHVPPGYSRRLYRKVEAQVGGESLNREGRIPLGIGDDLVALGSHLIYFWQTSAEFAHGVRFLYPGLRGGDHCVVFGHREATERVLALLRQNGFEPASLVEQGRLTILPRHVSARETLMEIRSAFEAAVQAGAPAIRYLGNLGMEQDPLPGSGIDDVLELEAKVTTLAADFPSLVLCMYDVNTLPGRVVLKGGFQTHPLAICGDHLVHNPYYVPEAEFLQRLHQAQ